MLPVMKFTKGIHSIPNAGSVTKVKGDTNEHQPTRPGTMM
jgi:hypothetical protein